MALRPFRATVGHQRIVSGKIKPWQEAHTRAVREQMQGINKHLSGILADAQYGLIEDIRLAFRPIFDLSQEYVPFYSGRLKRSGFFEVRRIARSKVPKRFVRRMPVLKIGYAAGGNPPYAVVVHENLEAYHRPPKRAKFLEAALREQQAASVKRLKLYMGERFRYDPGAQAQRV